MNKPKTTKRSRRFWILCAPLGVVAFISIAFCVPSTRSTLLRQLGQLGILDHDTRAYLLAKSATAGGTRGISQVLEIMLDDSDKVFSLVVLEYLWDEKLSSAHEMMRNWLDDEEIAWPNDQRKIRRCDLATYYFRRYVGEGRWDTAKSLAVEISDRNNFRQTVRDYLSEDGLPSGR